MAVVAISRPSAELSVGAAYQFAFKWHVIGLLLLASHIILTRQSIALFPLTLLAIGWLYARAPLAGVVVFFQFLIYQNWMISLFVTGMDREPTFILLQGTNFAALMLMGAIAWVRLYQSRWRQWVGTILTIITTTLVLITIYAMIGAAKEGVTPASIYFRLAATMALGALVGLDVGRVWGYRTIGIAFVVSAVLSMLLAIFEVLAPEMYYDATNAVQFMALKTLNDPKYDAFWSAKNVVFHNTAYLFNITGNGEGSTIELEQLRFNGTVMHPISYAYVLAAVGLVAWSVRQGGWLFLAFPLMLASGGKGGNLLFVCSMCLLAVWYTACSRPILLTCGGIMMVGYVGLGLLWGMDGGDYHVLGFLGGVHGFFSNPLGHGIGVGGNLSESAKVGLKWQDFQHFGASDFALESAVGVLLYQMGIAAAGVFGVFLVLLYKSPFGTLTARGVAPKRADLLFIVLAAVAINGIFQEEAYSPYAAGLMTLFCGILVANGRRPVEVLRPIQRMFTRTVHV